MKKVLITVPNLELSGGVSNYYNFMALDEFNNIRYFNINGGPIENLLLRLVERYISFFVLIFSVDIIHLNPSMNKKAFVRETIFIFLSILLNKKIVVFIRGWDENFENKIFSNAIYGFIFKHIWCRVDKYLILGTVFKSKLIELGVTNEIQLETTLSIYQSDVIKKIDLENRINLLFISRLVKEKGIFIALDTINILHKKYHLRNIYLKIAGDGDILSEMESYIKENQIGNIELLGSVVGKEKDRLFEESHIMLFPTYYGEGLPNSILEGMGSGMPIISRVNAGIPDQVVNGENGYLSKSKDPEWFALAIVKIISGDEFGKISLNNIKKAKKYSIEEIRKRLFLVYENL